MKRYWKKRKKRKPGFWVDVRLEAPNGSDNLLKLYVTPGAFNENKNVSVSGTAKKPTMRRIPLQNRVFLAKMRGIE